MKATSVKCLSSTLIVGKCIVSGGSIRLVDFWGMRKESWCCFQRYFNKLSGTRLLWCKLSTVYWNSILSQSADCSQTLTAWAPWVSTAFGYTTRGSTNSSQSSSMTRFLSICPTWHSRLTNIHQDLSLQFMHLWAMITRFGLCYWRKP